MGDSARTRDDVEEEVGRTTEVVVVVVGVEAERRRADEEEEVEEEEGQGICRELASAEVRRTTGRTNEDETSRTRSVCVRARGRPGR